MLRSCGIYAAYMSDVGIWDLWAYMVHICYIYVTYMLHDCVSYVKYMLHICGIYVTYMSAYILTCITITIHANINSYQTDRLKLTHLLLLEWTL